MAKQISALLNGGKPHLSSFLLSETFKFFKCTVTIKTFGKWCKIKTKNNFMT